MNKMPNENKGNNYGCMGKTHSKEILEPRHRIRLPSFNELWPHLSQTVITNWNLQADKGSQLLQRRHENAAENGVQRGQAMHEDLDNGVQEDQACQFLPRRQEHVEVNGFHEGQVGQPIEATHEDASENTVQEIRRVSSLQKHKHTRQNRFQEGQVTQPFQVMNRDVPPPENRIELLEENNEPAKNHNTKRNFETEKENNKPAKNHNTKRDLEIKNF